MKCGKVYIHYIEDCDVNKGGYYCEVYDTEEMDNRIDYFCVHTDDCDCNNAEEVEKFIRLYAEMYQ